MNKWVGVLIFLSLRSFAGEPSELDQNASCPPYDGDSSYRILFVGDSITRHGVNEHTIKFLGWDHTSGMAASIPSNDYATIVEKKISSHLGRTVVSCFHTFGGSGAVAERLYSMDKVIDVHPDLVVIQLGEHETEKQGSKNLAVAYRKLLEALSSLSGTPRIIALGPWAITARAPTGEYSGWPGEVDKVMKSVATEKGILFSSVRDISVLPEASGWGTSVGVRWHPNDIGHMLYAERIYRLFLEGEMKSK